MATTTGSRSTMAGVMKAESSRLSTMLWRHPRLGREGREARVQQVVLVRAIGEHGAHQVHGLDRRR
jgi:hypothetical protein